MGAKTFFTLQDYLALDEPDGPRFELSEGELILSPGTTYGHNEIREGLYGQLRRFFRRHPLGAVTSESDFLLGPATVRRPDVGVILAGRFTAEMRDAVPLPFAPDLVFEVVSQHDRPDALRLKTRQYLAAGTAAVWLLYPDTEVAVRHISSGEAEFSAAAGQALEEPEPLAGFSVPLREIFHPE